MYVGPSMYVGATPVNCTLGSGGLVSTLGSGGLMSTLGSAGGWVVVGVVRMGSNPGGVVGVAVTVVAD